MSLSPFASHIINAETAAQMIHVDFRHQNTQDRQLEATTSVECDMLQQLINACKIGEAEYIIELVNTSQCDVNMKDPHTGRSAMHVACYHDQSGALRSLLSLGASFHQLDHSGATPVHVAAAHGLECLKLLLQDHHHADGCARDGAGRTPLSHAASSGNLEAISVLLAHPSCGPGAMAIPDASGSLPIHQAASCGQAQVLKLLIHPLHGIGPDCEEEAPAPRRRSPLHLAAQMGHNAAVETLLALGANPGVLDAQDASPCHVAAENGHLGVLQILYQAGATCQSPDRDGWLPLHLAANQGHTNCVDFLLSACGSNVNEVNMISARNRGWTSLHCATKQKDVQMVLHLLACGADPTLRDETRGWTPLHYAASDGCTAVLDYALMGSPDLDSEATGNLSAPLSTALQGNSHSDLLPALVSAEMASRGLYSLAGGLIGHTPLSLAIVRGHDQSCDILIRVALWCRDQSQQKSESFAEATTAATETTTRGEWKPLGSVAGLVEVGVNNVIQTSARNHDVEAWMMYTRGSHSQSGWQYFEVEVLEEGSSGLFWVGWGTAAAEPQTSAAFSCFSSKQQGVKVSLGHKRRISDLVSPRSQGSDNYGELRMHPSSLLQTQLSLLGSSASGGLTLSPGAAGQHLCRSMLASSFTICSKDGNKQQPGQEGSTPFAPKTSKGDVLGILYNRMCNTISVTHNRKFIGVAFSNMIGFRGLGFVHHNPMMHNRGVTSPNGVSDHADGEDGWSCRITGCPSSWSEQSSCSSLPSTMSARSMNLPSTPSSMSSQPSALCPVIGLKSGSASLRFLSHDDSLFFKNMDSQLLREEQLHNPHYQDPLRSSPWQFKLKIHAMHFAASCNNLHALSALISHWPQHVNDRDDDGWSPLVMACVRGHVEAATALITAGVDVDAVTSYGTTPLIFAVRQRHVEVVRLLIDKGADIKAVDHNQRTLLMRAARSGSIPTIELLLEKGVDFHATDKFGRNVLQFTKEKQVFDFLYAVDHQNRLIPGCYKDAQASMRDRPRCEILASDLEMGRDLGHGGCGVVRLAKWCGTQVAVKEMHHNMDGDTAFQEFYAEAELMKELRHTNVIQFLGVVSGASHFKIVTEYAVYGDLLKVLRRKEHQLTDKQLIWLAVGIARGMMYLHGLRPAIVHRDLKPQNCLVTHNLVVKVGDFGLSSIKQRTMFSRSFMLTPIYMAPEMFQGRYDEKVDVYSFGAILYQMVTGHAPWSQQLSQKDAIIPILYHNYFNPNPECRRFLRDFVPSEVDTEIRELIVACLDPLPEERPTFQNVLLRLEGFSDRVKIRLK